MHAAMARGSGHKITRLFYSSHFICCFMTQNCLTNSDNDSLLKLLLKPKIVDFFFESWRSWRWYDWCCLNNYHTSKTVPTLVLPSCGPVPQTSVMACTILFLYTDWLVTLWMASSVKDNREMSMLWGRTVKSGHALRCTWHRCCSPSHWSSSG